MSVRGSVQIRYPIGIISLEGIAMGSKPANLDREPCRNEGAEPGFRKACDMVEARTEEEAFYQAQARGFDALRTRSQSRLRRRF